MALYVQFLLKIADAIEANLDELVEAESKDQGKPVSVARAVDIPRAAYNFRFFAQSILHEVSHCSRSVHNSDTSKPSQVNMVQRVPVGVAVLISPWNLPLYL